MLTDWPPFHALAKALAEGHPCLRVAGLQGAARALAVAELLQTTPRPALVLVPAIAGARRTCPAPLSSCGAPVARGAGLLRPRRRQVPGAGSAPQAGRAAAGGGRR